MRTGILGGTFDPIHIAHLHAAECALHQLGLDRVLVVPAGDPWQKAGRAMSPDHLRLEMCRIAVDGAPGVEVDDREITRSGPTYTIDTLESFPRDEELFLIVGSDAAEGLSTWHRWEEIANRVAVAVAPRPGSDVNVPGAVRIEMSLLDVSGTDIRRRAAGGHPFRYLVTAPVHAFIVANGLYTDLARDDMVQGSSMPEDQS